MTTLDELTESAVSVLINATYADRGDNYQRSGRIQGPRKTDTGLSALCRGSPPIPTASP